MTTEVSNTQSNNPPQEDYVKIVDKLLSSGGLTKERIVRIIFGINKANRNRNLKEFAENKSYFEAIKAVCDFNLQKYVEGIEDSPINSYEAYRYSQWSNKVSSGRNIDVKTAKLADIIFKILHPKKFTKSTIGLMNRGYFNRIAKQTVKKGGSLAGKLTRKARKHNVKGIIAGGLAGLVGLDSLDNKIQEWFEKRSKKKHGHSDEVLELLEQKDKAEKEKIRDLSKDLSQQVDEIKRINKNKSETRLSEDLISRISDDDKLLKELANSDGSKKYLENILKSKILMSSKLRKKIQDSISKVEDIDDEDDHNLSNKDSKRLESEIISNSIDDFERVISNNLKELTNAISDILQPQAIGIESKDQSNLISSTTTTLPEISVNTQNTVENLTKVDNSLDRGFIELGKKVGNLDEGLDRISGLLEKQISLQRKSIDNSSSVSKSKDDKDKDSEDSSLDDLFDLFDGDGNNNSKKKGKGKNRKKNRRKGKKPGKSPKVKGGKLGKLGSSITKAGSKAGGLASKVLSPIGTVASSILPSSGILASGLGTVGKLAGKVALPLAAAMSIYDAYQGFDKDKANSLGFDGNTTKGKSNSAASSVLSGLTLGLVGEDIFAKGFQLQDQIQDGIVNALGGKDSPIGFIADKFLNPLDNLMDGFDSLFSDKKKEDEKEKIESKSQPTTNTALPKSKQEDQESKPVDEKELLNKVLDTANQLSPVNQFKNLTDHLFDSPGAKKVFDELTNQKNLMQAVTNPLGSLLGGLWNSATSFFAQKETSPTASTSSSSSNGSLSQSWSGYSSGSGGVSSTNIGQYQGSAIGDGDLDNSGSSGKFGDVQALLDYGMSFVGKVKYGFGSKDPTTGSVDCSGFVKHVYTRVWGVKGMPDGAAYQFTWKKGKVINKLEDLQPGDIYFMNSPAKFAVGRPLGISHVGIYAGNGNLLHSSSKKGVNLMPLNSYYKKYFVGAKRLTESGGSSVITPEQEGSSVLSVPSSNPIMTGEYNQITGSSGSLTDPNNPNAIGTGDGAIVGSDNNEAAIPYKELSNANADKNAKADLLTARSEFIKQSLANGVSKKDIATMLGQMDHETGGFKRTSENLNYSSLKRLDEVYGSRIRKSGVDPKTLLNNPEALANVVYQDKNGATLGNTQAGDGWKFRGRGLVQLTGRENYTKVGKALGIDLVNNPELANDPQIATKIALWWHKNKVGHGVDVKTATKKINGGYNGLEDRIKKTQGWMSGRLDEEIAKIQSTSGTATASNQSLPTPPTQGTASSIPETIAAPKAISTLVESRPITESLPTPPTHSQEIQMNQSLMASSMGQYMQPLVDQSRSMNGSMNPSGENAIDWGDWINDPSLIALQRLINGGLG